MTRKDLLGIQDLTTEEILEILDTAETLREVSSRPIKKVPTLRGKTVVNLFIEPSTRTRISFELAALRLSADVINFTAEASSLKKGETLKDTARNLEALNADIIVIRHSASGAPHFLSRVVSAHVVNAGDGAHEGVLRQAFDVGCLVIVRAQMNQIAPADASGRDRDVRSAVAVEIAGGDRVAEICRPACGQRLDPPLAARRARRRVRPRRHHHGRARPGPHRATRCPDARRRSNRRARRRAT